MFFAIKNVCLSNFNCSSRTEILLTIRSYPSLFQTFTMIFLCFSRMSLRFSGYFTDIISVLNLPRHTYNYLT